MPAQLIDGKAISAYIKNQAAEEAEKCKEVFRAPCLAVILVGHNAASEVYVNNKKKACELCGISSQQINLPEETTQEELLRIIAGLNADDRVDGILCQLPLPKHLDEKAVTEAIAPQKDVDGFHPQNVGKLVTGEKGFVSCTPAGIIEMLKYIGADMTGKHCVIVGRSNIVGKPAALLMLRENATVTVCHSKTENLSEITKTADILIAAVGKPRFITADMLKPGAVVIDVGINRLENGKLCGDVDFDGAFEKASAITPVPGGVGPMTIAMLMKNTVAACKQRGGIL